MFMKKMVTKATSAALVLTFALGASASAHELTPEQNAVMKAANEVKVTASGTSTKGISSTSGGAWQLKVTRGSFLAWSDAIVNWESNGKKITKSEASQASGWVFPNIVKEKGITKQNVMSSDTSHVYLSKTSIGAGIVTPWGDVEIYETDFSDYIRVNHDGSYDNW
ncbi:hypothetical protein [Brevibacillus borstelensis]|uniref:hypothetical protein n=1 Tax=Brevibacillus borstelensis TaxID=45462 RepID=UPI0030C1058A